MFTGVLGSSSSYLGNIELGLGESSESINVAFLLRQNRNVFIDESLAAQKQAFDLASETDRVNREFLDAITDTLPVVPPPPSPRNVPLVRRDPNLPRVVGGFTDTVSAIVNSLGRQGQLVQVSAAEYQITVSPSSLQLTPGPQPDASQYYGILWVDVSGHLHYLMPNGTDNILGDSITALTGDVSAVGPGAVPATLASIIAAGGPTGAADTVPIITWDAKGRLTAVSQISIQITQSQVDDLVADLATINASLVVADAAADTTTWPLLSGVQTGTLFGLTDAGLTYNASTNALSVGGFVFIGGANTYPLDVTSTGTELYGEQFSRTQTGTSGTLANLRVSTPVQVTAGTSAIHASMYLTTAVNSLVTNNFTGLLIGSFYECLYNGTGTLPEMSCLRGTLQLNTLGGVVTLGRTFFSNIAVLATMNLAVGFDSAISMTNASGLINGTAGFNHFRAQATGTITAGGSISQVTGCYFDNFGKTGVTRAVGTSIAAQSGAANANICMLLGTLTVPSITSNLVLSNAMGIAAPTADVAQIACVDNGGGNAEFQVQPEAGGILAFGTNVLRTPAGSSTSFAKHGGCVADFIADVGNVGTGEDDLFSTTLPASILAVNGDKVTATYAGIYVGHATATRQLKVYFGGTVIYDSTALVHSVNSDWAVSVTVIRESSTVVRCTVTYASTLATNAPYTKYTRVTGLTLTNTQVIKITGEAAAAGAATDDIVAKLGSVSWLSAG